MKEIPITLLKVKELLEKRKDEEEDLTYIQKVTLDYATRYAPNIDREKEQELIAIFKDNFNMKKESAIQLISLSPRSVDELKLVLGKDERAEEDLIKILELCIQYLG